MADPNATSLGATRPGASDQPGPLPARLGRYEVTGRLGAGGMGEVLAVKDELLGREVAAKVALRGLDREAAARLAREARITGALEHPSIVPVHELGTDADGRWFFTMKRVAGRDLERLLAEEEPSLSERLRIFLKICDALAFAHAKGVIHRDLKPANIMVGRFGEVLVMDFGLARLTNDPASADGTARVELIDDTLSPSRTRTGSVVGTPAYMSPEQAGGRTEEVDARSDVYALGAVLYQMLAGVPPYEGSTAWDVIAQVSEGPPAPPAQRSPDRAIPRELDFAVMRAMAVDPGDRYPDVASLARDITAFTDGRMLAAAHYGLGQRLVRWARRRRAALVAVGAAGLVAGSIFAIQRVAVVREHRARRAALQERVRALDPAPVLARAAVIAEPTGDSREQARADLARLRELTQALGDWRALEPHDAGVSGALHRALVALGQVAFSLEELSLAELALGQARALEPEGPAAALLGRVDLAHRARRERRETRARALLALARSGQLEQLTATGDGAFQAALFELAGSKSPEVVAVLADALDAWRERLHATTRAALYEAGRSGNAADDQRLSVALDDFVATLVPSVDGRLEPVLEGERREAVRRAMDRLVARDRERAGTLDERHWGLVLADHQARELSQGGIAGASEVRLACTALGLIGAPGRAAESLARCLWAAWDEPLAIHAGVALVRLAAVDARALPWLVELVRPPAEQHRMNHWREGGPWWQRIAAELGRAELRLDGAGQSAYVHAVALHAQGRHPEALAMFDAAIAGGDDRIETLIARAEVLRAMGELARSRADLDHAIERDPGRDVVWSARGLVRNAQGDLDGALADLARGIELAPTIGQGWRLRAEVLLERGRLAEAMADADRACRIDGDVRPRITRAKIARAMGDRARAISELDWALGLAPASIEALTERAACHRADERFEAALADLDRAVVLAPTRMDLLVVRADVRRMARRVDLAREDCDTILAREPDRTSALEVRALVLVALGQLEAALADAMRTTTLDPARPDAWQTLGQVERARRRFPAAIAAYDHAIQLAEGKRFDLYADRGLTRLDAGDPAGAASDYTRALELDPSIWQGYSMRALARMRAGDAAGALADYDVLVVRRPEHVGGWVNRGDLLHRAGRFAEAAESFARATQLAPSTWQCWAGLGNAHARVGDAPRAIQALAKAAELAPPEIAAQIARQIAGLEGR